MYKIAIHQDVRKAIAGQKKLDRELGAKIDKWLRSGTGREVGWTIDEFAYRLGVPREHLSYYFAAHYGTSPKRFYKKIRIEDAKHIMRTHPHISLQEVAWLVGIVDTSNFRAQFQSEEGMSVMEWREKHTRYKKK